MCKTASFFPQLWLLDVRLSKMKKEYTDKALLTYLNQS